ncbi:MAG TPA: tetratricopeptide repeat protein [Candidatus Methylomirabilis sp.]|nr:tetratricopeptide repeat protein [Candidatus Methylomirabilis sp.]
MRGEGWGRIIAGLVMVGSLLAGTFSPIWAQLPSESDVFVDRGIVAYDAKDYTTALQSFQEALRLNPDNVNALYYTGLTYMALERFAEAQAVLEQAGKLAPQDVDVAFQLALSYFAQEQFDQAEPLLRQVYAAQPTHKNLGYYLGIIEYRKQNYREALRFFQTAVPSDENFAQLNRFYAGLSLSAMGLASQARTEIDEALRLQPASPLTGPAERFREVLGPAAEAERHFRVDAKVGFFYDDNVPVIPLQSGDAAAEAARKVEHRSTGELGYVRFEYTPLRTPDWEANIAYSLLQTVNNSVSDFNIQNHTGMANLAYKSRIREMPAVWNLTYQYDYISLDDRNFVSRHTIAPAMTLVWDAVNLSQALLRYQNKDFMHEKTLVDPSDDRDASNYMAGLAHTFRFAADRHFIRMGYQFDWEGAQGSNWTYLGHRAILGGQYTLPWWDIRVRYDLDIHFRDYRNKHTFLPTGITEPAIHRVDRDLNSLLSISKDFPGNITVSLEYLLNRNFSNLAVFDYIRNVVSANVSWRY